MTYAQRHATARDFMREHVAKYDFRHDYIGCACGSAITDHDKHLADEVADLLGRVQVEAAGIALRGAAEVLEDMALTLMSENSDVGNALTAAVVDRCRNAVRGLAVQAESIYGAAS